MKKAYCKPSAEWVSFQVDEALLITLSGGIKEIEDDIEPQSITGYQSIDGAY